MKVIRSLFVLVLLLVPGISRSAPAQSAPETAPRIKVLLMHGGHGFEHAEFFNLFKTNTDLAFTAVEHPNAHALLRPENADSYDVIVLYDLWRDISEEAKSNFVDRLKDGKGLVV